jgi:exopolysaccharide biosynthesis polyprenyl glycosylphosphotransferase
MIHQRMRGLYRLLGAMVVLILPLLFFVVTWVSATVLGRVDYELVKFPVYLGGAVVAGLFSLGFYREPTGLASRAGWIWRTTNLQTAILATFMFGLVFATKDQGISRVMLGSYILLAWLTLLALNTLAPRWMARVAFSGRNLRSCLVVGSPEATLRVRDWLESTVAVGYEVVGQLTWDGAAVGKTSWPVLGPASNLEKVIQERGINQVILLETRQSPELVRRVARTCDTEGCRLLIYNPWANTFPQPLIAVNDAGHTFFMLREEPLEHLTNRFLKRALDLSLAIPVVFLALPVLIPMVWLGQRLQSPGPVFFRQKRRGFNRREFVLFKFRTMHEENGHAIDESKQATKGDTRVFPFGEWLRHTSIDELPQFINVLRGEMSAVGPRPHLPEHDVLFHEQVDEYPQRHFAKPGITGLAQSLGYRGEITEIDLLRRRVRYDLEYINNWTLLLDIEIILRTIIQVLRPPKTAY